jgi:phenylpropionate dioxygenase-like ring-hydroxylating dioxygenase large terminal subunit
MQAGTLTSVERGYAGLPIPFGWFAVAMSDEIGNGEIRTLHYFGTEFVVWRGEDGQVHAVDPHCPHMGAHLGVGSEVVGNDLRCAYHHWRFKGEGGVTDNPYTQVIPPRLKRA